MHPVTKIDWKLGFGFGLSTGRCYHRVAGDICRPILLLSNGDVMLFTMLGVSYQNACMCFFQVVDRGIGSVMVWVLKHLHLVMKILLNRTHAMLLCDWQSGWDGCLGRSSNRGGSLTGLPAQSQVEQQKVASDADAT